MNLATCVILYSSADIYYVSEEEKYLVKEDSLGYIALGYTTLTFF